MKHLVKIALLGCTVLAGCRTGKPVTTTSLSQTPITTIAFGSCSDQKRPQPLWDDIVAQKAQLWIWIGDNIYGDTENMDTLRAKYDLQKSNPIYQQLRQSTSVIGVWDDHDYGVNDGGKEYTQRETKSAADARFSGRARHQSVTQTGRSVLITHLRA
jgi:alkaline phosphatase D